MSERIPVTEFHVIPCVCFNCPECGFRNRVEHHSKHHVSTGDHCNCGAFFVVDWNEEGTEVHVEMAKKGEDEEQTCIHCGMVSKADVRWCPGCKRRLH